jgi:hypothetical protein
MIDQDELLLPAPSWPPGALTRPSRSFRSAEDGTRAFGNAAVQPRDVPDALRDLLHHSSRVDPAPPL